MGAWDRCPEAKRALPVRPLFDLQFDVSESLGKKRVGHFPCGCLNQCRVDLQTGIPFGDTTMVKDFLGITTQVKFVQPLPS